MIRILYAALGFFLSLSLVSREYNKRIESVTLASFELAAASYMYSCVANTDKSLGECHDKAQKYLDDLLSREIMQIK
jgi:hypothetical protein